MNKQRIKFDEGYARDIIFNHKLGKFFVKDKEVEILDFNYLYAGNRLLLVKTEDSENQEHDDLDLYNLEGNYVENIIGNPKDCQSQIEIEVYCE